MALPSWIPAKKSGFFLRKKGGIVSAGIRRQVRVHFRENYAISLLAHIRVSFRMSEYPHRGKEALWRKI